jgi:hypothetical protein
MTTDAQRLSCRRQAKLRVIDAGWSYEILIWALNVAVTFRAASGTFPAGGLHFLKDKKRSKKSFADNQPYGSLRDFEINRSGGPRKQDIPCGRPSFFKRQKTKQKVFYG